MTPQYLCLGSIALTVLFAIGAGASQVLTFRSFGDNFRKTRRQMARTLTLGLGGAVSSISAIGWGIMWAIEVFAK